MSSGDKLFASVRGFYGLKGLVKFFTKQISLFSKDLSCQGSALVFIDSIILISNYKQQMLQLIEQLHDIAYEGNLKLAAEKFQLLFLHASHCKIPCSWNCFWYN